MYIIGKHKICHSSTVGGCACIISSATPHAELFQATWGKVESPKRTNTYHYTHTFLMPHNFGMEGSIKKLTKSVESALENRYTMLCIYAIQAQSFVQTCHTSCDLCTELCELQALTSLFFDSKHHYINEDCIISCISRY